jgi:DNA-binding MarR family transcriptional regulator
MQLSAVRVPRLADSLIASDPARSAGRVATAPARGLRAMAERPHASSQGRNADAPEITDCLALLWALYSVVRRLRPAGPGDPVDLPSMYVLYQVLRRPGIGVTAVAGEAGAKASTVSRQVAALVEAGYLTRTSALKDCRAVSLQITPAGRQAVVAVARSRATAVLQAFAGWTKKDRRACIGYAMRLLADLDQILGAALAPRGARGRRLPAGRASHPWARNFPVRTAPDVGARSPKPDICHLEPEIEGLDLLMALFSVMRRLRTAGPGEEVDLPSMYVLYQVLLRPRVRVSVVAGEVGLDASTVSRHVTALVKLGYLTRTTAEDDKRAAALALTERGREVVEKVTRSRAQLCQDVFADWSADDRRRCVAYALRFVAGLGTPPPRLGAEPVRTCPSPELGPMT